MSTITALGSKIRKIREAEGLGRAEFCKITGIPKDSLIRIETKGSEPKSGVLLAVCAKFEKYALWLTTDKVAPEVGQISPEIEESRRNLKATD
jgi:transcriptional regulator with XRE-family HTH domain